MVNPPTTEPCPSSEVERRPLEVDVDPSSGAGLGAGVTPAPGVGAGLVSASAFFALALARDLGFSPGAGASIGPVSVPGPGRGVVTGRWTIDSSRRRILGPWLDIGGGNASRRWTRERRYSSGPSGGTDSIRMGRTARLRPSARLTSRETCGDAFAAEDTRTTMTLLSAIAARICSVQVSVPTMSSGAIQHE